MARNPTPRPWLDVIIDTARKIAPWPTPDDDARTALDGTTPPRAIRRKR